MPELQTVPYTQFDGIILRTIAYRESDLICRVLTPERGKCAVIAKNSRKPSSRFQVHLEIFDCGSFQTLPGRGAMEVLSNFRPSTSFRALRENLDKYIIAGCIAESFDNLIHDDPAHAECDFYEALSLGLHAVSDSVSLPDILKAGYLTLHAGLQIAGFASSESQKPSTHGMISAMQLVIDSTGRELQSYPAMVELLKRFGRHSSERSSLEDS